MRCVGDEHEVKSFDVYSPKLIAMIKKPSSTICDRSIGIQLQRKPPGKKVASLRKYKDEALDLQRKILRWATDNKSEIAYQLDTQPLPYCENDRALDCWEVLFAVARVVNCYDLAEESFQFIELQNNLEDDNDTSILLLKDIRTFFTDSRMFSRDIVDSLVSIKDAPWSEKYYGQPFSERRLAKLLSPYGVKPCCLSQHSAPKRTKIRFFRFQRH